MFRYIDIHTHLNFAAFNADREEVISRAQRAGVAMINVGTHHGTSKKALDIAERHEGVYAIVGLHPVHTVKSFHDVEETGEGGNQFTSKGESFDVEQFRPLALHPKTVALGECGLDYYRMEHEGWNMEHTRQEEAFRRQIELAIEVKKPLMLHIRNGSGRSAYRDAFDMLKSHDFNLTSGRRPGNLHFFAGSIEEAKPFLDRGYTFSFTGVITFAKEYAELVRYLPLDRILSETDAPYVAPAPYRGKRNEPLYVEEVVKAIAFIKNEKLEIVQERMLRNAEGLFGIKLS